MKNNFVKFDDFLNPNNKLERFKNKNIHINDIYPCSYVVYFILEHCNGEIFDNYFIYEKDYNLDKLKEYYLSSYVIYAINILDKIVCEVV